MLARRPFTRLPQAPAHAASRSPVEESAGGRPCPRCGVARTTRRWSHGPLLATRRARTHRRSRPKRDGDVQRPGVTVRESATNPDTVLENRRTHTPTPAILACSAGPNIRWFADDRHARSRSCAWVVEFEPPSIYAHSSDARRRSLALANSRCVTAMSAGTRRGGSPIQLLRGRLGKSPP